MAEQHVDTDLFREIGYGAEWVSVEPVLKGWSGDRKHRVRTKDGEVLLLRLSDAGQYDAKKKEYEIVRKYSRLGFLMSAPKAFGLCRGGAEVYMLLSWIDGVDLEDALPSFSEKDQYLLGRQAGEILRKIHSVPLDPEDAPSHTKQEKKLFQLSKYEDSDLRIPGDENAVRYVKEHIDRIWTVPPVYLHGDFHPGNLILTESGTIGVIDFNRWEVGDPYEEFYKLQSFGTETSVPYCIGQIDAYFGDDVPQDFWAANAVYVAQSSLFSVKWAERFGQQDVDAMVRRALRAREDFDDFRSVVPKWYSEKPV